MVKSQTTLPVDYNNGIELLNPGPFQIEIVEISNRNSRCLPTTISLVKNFELLPPISVTASEIACEDDSLFSAKVTLTGGNGKFKIIRQLGITDVDTINLAANMYRVFFKLENYRLIIQGSKDFCSQKELNISNLPKPTCDCDFVYSDVKAGSISVANGILLNNQYRLCSGNNFHLDITNLKLEPTTDTLIVFALATASIESQILKNAVKSFPTITQNFNEYQCQISDLLPNAEYYLVAGIIQKNRNNPNGLENFEFTCRKFSPSVRIYFNETPQPAIVLDGSKYCSNESNVIVKALSLVNKKVAGYTSGNYTWKLGNANQNIGHFTTIDSSKASLYLSGTDTAKTYLLTFKEALNYPGGLVCQSSSTINIETSKSISPDTASIIYWPGNILVCTADSTDVSYKWGYFDHTLTTGNMEIFIQGGNKKYLLNQDDILDLFEKRTYFVDLKDNNLVNNPCITRIYFSATEALERNWHDAPDIISLFPNPSDGSNTYIKIKGRTSGIYDLLISDVQGRVIAVEKIFKNSNVFEYKINQNLVHGYYIVRLWHHTMISPKILKCIIH